MSVLEVWRHVGSQGHIHGESYNTVAKIRVGGETTGFLVTKKQFKNTNINSETESLIIGTGPH